MGFDSSTGGLIPRLIFWTSVSDKILKAIEVRSEALLFFRDEIMFRDIFLCFPQKMDG